MTAGVLMATPCTDSLGVGTETKARKGDGEYVRLSEEAGKHESGDNHGHVETQPRQSSGNLD